MSRTGWAGNSNCRPSALVAALERIRESYCAQLAVHPIKGADEVLEEVEAALVKADKAKNVV